MPTKSTTELVSVALAMSRRAWVMRSVMGSRAAIHSRADTAPSA
ncbi:Uncharacterised protein [Mycobacteroides abscessus subsp. abscessus]|nr:Uncharacterised protein [Mycobacteroides abscessus subsp. abscessus]